MFLKFSEELLCMRPRLRTGPRLDILLNHVPVFAILGETLQEFLMLLVCPFALVKVAVNENSTRSARGTLKVLVLNVGEHYLIKFPFLKLFKALSGLVDLL